jgi:hypothetical protein
MTTPPPARIVFPWEPGYNPGATIEQVIEAVTPPQLKPVVDQIVTPVVEAVLPTAPAAPAPAQPTNAAPAGDFSSSLQDAVLRAAQGAALAALPSIEKQVISMVLGGITATLPQPNAPEPLSKDVFTKASARSRALRTFFGGLAMAILWGIISALGSVNGDQFFTKTGLISVATIVVSSVIGSIVSYFGRIHFEPKYAELAPPGK